MSKVSIWDASAKERPIRAEQTVLARGGFLTAEKGQIVIVAVLDTYGEAAALLRALDPALVATEPK